MALVEAAQSFDPARNVKFATYARYRICGALRDVQRALVTQGSRDDLENAPKFMSLISTSEEFGEVMLSHPDRSVGEGIELADLLESWLKKLPPAMPRPAANSTSTRKRRARRPKPSASRSRASPTSTARPSKSSTTSRRIRPRPEISSNKRGSRAARKRERLIDPGSPSSARRSPCLHAVSKFS